MPVEVPNNTLQIPTARAFVPLLKPRRYKGARGGRGSGKSHFFCENLVDEALRGHTRAVCLREVQNSIKDSVKQTIEDKIKRYDVGHRFKITEREITGPNDSLFIFRGMAKATAESIKSLEAFKYAYFEEAHSMTARSLELLTPTIRAEDSELWFSWNPEMKDDPIDVFFRDNYFQAKDPDFVCIHVTYRENPWFPDALRRDMERDKKRDPEKYRHVWEGEYQQSSEARVFRNWRVEDFDTPDRAEFMFGADFGFSVDPATLIRCYIKGNTLYIDREVVKQGCEINLMPSLWDTLDPDKKRMARNWIIIADSSRPETISYMRHHGYPRIRPAVKGKNSIEDGVEFLKSFDIVVHPRCKHTIDELTFYSYKVDEKTKLVLPILVDDHNHIIDALRYAIEPLRRSTKSFSLPMRSQ